MKQILRIFVVLLLAKCSTAFSQTEVNVNGVKLPRTIDFKGRTIELNGVGIRSKLWFDVYTQALYLSKLSQDPKDILDSRTLMAVRIQITSSLVSSKKFSKSINNGLKKSVGDEKWAFFKPQLDLLEKFINSEEIVEKDIFNLVFNPDDESLWIVKNDIVKGQIPGLDFKQAFFGIWLSDNPIDKTLKNDLLGIYK